MDNKSEFMSAAEARALTEQSEESINKHLKVVLEQIKKCAEAGKNQYIPDYDGLGYLKVKGAPSKYTSHVISTMYLSTRDLQLVYRLQKLGYNVKEEWVTQDMSKVLGSMETEERLVDLVHIVIGW